LRPAASNCAIDSRRCLISFSTIRLLLAAVKQKEVDDRIVADDAIVAGIVEKLIKQRRESIAQFEAAGRKDLVDKERAELELLTRYLPQQWSAAEVDAAVDAAIAQVAGEGAVGGQAIGKVMALLKPQLAGRADMSKVSARVKERLAASRG
jgi:uncharacterized protein